MRFIGAILGLAIIVSFLFLVWRLVGSFFQRDQEEAERNNRPDEKRKDEPDPDKGI